MKYLITPTLLNSLYYYLGVDEEWAQNAKDSFLGLLRKEEFKPTPAIQAGVLFEKNCVDYARGFRPDLLDEYWGCVAEIGDELIGAAFQVKVQKEVTVGEHTFLLFGYVDALKGPIASDIKFTGTYEFPKFKDTAQHHIYLECLETVPIFRYLISDGRKVYQEQYTKKDCRQVAEMISEFLYRLKNWDEALELFDKNWRAR